MKQSLAELADIEVSIDLLPELPVHAEWLRLVAKYRVSGKNILDARLVAAMNGMAYSRSPPSTARISPDMRKFL